MSRTGRIVLGVAILAALLGASVLLQIDDRSRIEGVETALDEAAQAQQEAGAAEDKAQTAKVQSGKSLDYLRGERGIAGVPGTIGQLGQRGERGLPGIAVDGTRGTTGQDGAAGRPGADGEVGATGTTGETGATGAQGSQGEPGSGPTAEEIATAVQAYLSGKEFQCTPNVDPPGTFTCSFP